jgi:hypothetical protein
MDEPTGKKTIPLILFGYSGWVKDEVIDDFLIGKTSN